MSHLAGKTAIVTGGAKGIGFAIARKLSEAGANVVLSDIDEAAAKAAAEQLNNATAVACDVRDEDQVKSLIETAVATYGGLHIMIPNAGIMTVAPLTGQDLATWRAAMSINLDGVFLSIRYAAPAITASGGGSIVNIGSVTALASPPLGGAYSAAKAAVVSLTKTAAMELRDQNVRVNVVLPGFVETALVSTNAERFESALGLPEGSFDGAVSQKQGRYGTADEVAEAVMFFVSDKASFCNGSGLVLDGGLHASLF
ncbi:MULTISPECIES: SDR family NAD(P)-dependent oxidoreductase [Gordonia]|uniref:SDR family NAD(P)-dependent oxidoreductase n=1 Tax=Gordonia TaxID=2053 RepID=UPI001EF5F222|nr:glucose 1-dehydrogenase [Gordonia sp. McavH-238-E]MCG7631446.1 glucose 1-dehydrogenase [Gordonia sp. McavH-238-E]